MFVCPLCRQEYIITAKLCEKCDKIRHLVQVYGIDRIYDQLDNIFVVNPAGTNEKIQELRKAREMALEEKKNKKDEDNK